MRAHRYQWGALAWLLTLQFFVVETVAQLRSPIPYSRTDDTISALGASASPAHVLMNASFVAQGLLIALGLVLLGPALLGRGRRAAVVLLGLAALGVVLVGLAPQDSAHSVHSVGALLHLLGGGLGLVALAYAVRPRSEVAGTVLVILGIVATAMTVFFVTGVTHFLGTGGTERAAAYPVPIGLAFAGVVLWRLAGPGPDADRHDRGTGRREERAAARAERERMARERDAALEAAAARRAADTVRTDPSAHDVDLDEHWRTPRGPAD